MKQFDKDVMHWKDYDFAVINDDLENCYKKIIKFNRNEFDDFTIIKVNYVQPE